MKKELLTIKTALTGSLVTLSDVDDGDIQLKVIGMDGARRLTLVLSAMEWSAMKAAV